MTTRLMEASGVGLAEKRRSRLVDESASRVQVAYTWSRFSQGGVIRVVEGVGATAGTRAMLDRNVISLAVILGVFLAACCGARLMSRSRYSIRHFRLG